MLISVVSKRISEILHTHFPREAVIQHELKINKLNG